MKRIISLIVLAFLVFPAVILAGHDGSFSNLPLSQNTVSISVGQIATVTIFPPSNSTVNVFYISNTSVVSASINGKVVNLTGVGNGSAVVRVCTSDLHCAEINVNVSGSFSGSISFNPSSVSLNAGASTTVTIFNNTGQSLYIASNSVASVASVQLSGNTLSINAISQGITSVTVCAFNTSACASLGVTVTGSNNPVSLNPSNVSLSVGQNSSISILGGYSAYFISSNSNPTIISAHISGTTLFVNALNLGNAQIMVCANSAPSQCAAATVNVLGSGNISLSQTSVSLNVGQTVNVSIFGNFSSYYVSSNSNPNVVSANISGSTLNLFGINTGTSTVTVCAVSASNVCASANVTVGTISGNLYFLTTSLNNAPTGGFYTAQLLVAGSSPFSFSISSGNLPSGMFLSSSGLISGTPTLAGTYNFTVRVQDSANRVAFQNFSLAVSGTVLGGLIYNNGTLINDGGTIWITYKNTKAGFANMSAFLGLGYKTSSVISASTVNLSNQGFVVNHSNIAHPWGSWIKSGNTIYFVHESGLIPISHYDIFVGNGGRDHLVVTANQSDFAKPILSLMNNNDPRLRP